MRALEPVVTEVTAVQWGPDWNAMLVTATHLGEKGMLFDIKFASDDDRRRGVNIYPELHLLDTRFRTHVVTHGLWIVVYPGYRQFRVLNSEELAAQYQDKETPA